MRYGEQANKRTKHTASDKGIAAGFFTMKRIILLLLLMSVVFVGLIWYAGDWYRQFKIVENQIFRMIELNGIIMHLDEVLTMSTKMATATGDLKWEDRYRSFEPQLDAAIKEAIDLSSATFLIDESVTSTGAANIKLVAMENRAFDLVRQGNHQAAMALLHSAEYEEQKRVYSEGMKRFIAATQGHIKERLDKHRRMALGTAAFLGIAVSLVVFVWLAIVQMHKRLVERKQSEEALVESENKFRSISTSATDAIIMMDQEGRVSFWNESAERIFGYSQTEAMEQNIHYLLAPKRYHEAYQKGFSHFQGTGEGPALNKTLELEALKKDGTEFPIELTVAPVKLGDRWHSVGIVRDISERKRAEQARAELLKQLGDVNKELSDFAYIVSHDLKAPLRGIKQLAEWISTDYADKLDEQGREQIQLLSARADRMRNLIDGVLQYSRLGRTKEKQIPVDINELVSGVIDMVAPPENIAVTVENQLPLVECEETRIVQVFENLLSNAVKYMDKPEGRIRIGCVEECGFWKFSVADNGCGIKEEHFEKIFEIFRTLSPRDEVESTGVGLSVVKKIIDGYGGMIWVESKPGEGSTFFFTLPRREMGVTYAELKADTAC